MKKVINRGFTLIELLVVIAIIGILASIVLVSLNSARTKGKDTRVISDVNQARVQLESDLVGSVYQDLYNTTVSSGNLAATLTTAGVATGLTALGTDATTNGPSSGAGLFYVIDTNSTTGAAGTPNAKAYAVYGTLANGNYFCVDSTGKNNVNAGAKTTTVCP